MIARRHLNLGSSLAKMISSYREGLVSSQRLASDHLSLSLIAKHSYF